MTVDMFQSELDAVQQRVEADALAEAKATERLREFEADFTPRPVARAVLEAVMAGTPMNYRGTKCIVGPPSSVWPAVGRGRRALWVSRGEPLVMTTARGGVVSAHHTHAPILERDGDLRVFRVLDVCAGAGVWASQVRHIAALLGIKVHITAVEYREEEREHLVRHADEVIIGDWHEALGMVLDERGVWVFGPDGPREYDLIVGNPAFSHARAPVRPEWPPTRYGDDGKAIKPTAEETRIRRELKAAAVDEGKLEELAKYDPEGSMPVLCLRSAPAVVLYLTQQCWTKTASGWLVRRICPPSVAHDIPGSVAHRGPGVGMDSIPYAGFMWTRDHKGATATNMLDPIEVRSWKVRPGTETDEWLTEHGVPFLAAT